MDFFRTLHRLLTTQIPSEKIKGFQAFYEAYRSGKVRFEGEHTPALFTTPSYAAMCEIVEPLMVPKRRNLTQVKGQVVLIHAITHIEYSAIDLALDHAYRFHGMSKAYYDDWLSVAEDEIRHFLMLEEILHRLGSAYGQVPVHDALFEASQRTQTLLERMAVVPRFLEANGLDATPEILQRLERLPKTPILDAIISALKLIVAEEVDHVLKGDRWFDYACKLEGVPRSVFFEIIERHYPQSFPRKKGINIAARQQAGFSCGELNIIAAEKVC